MRIAGFIASNHPYLDFAVPEVIERLRDLAVGSHAISFFSSQEEARDQAMEFLAGTPPDQAAAYWVSSPTLQTYYTEKLADEVSGQVGCVRVLPHSQVEWSDGKLRPVEQVLDFVQAHPQGVTAAGETITQYWAPENVADHVEYEQWFQELPRETSRFLCPYDLRRIPSDLAPETLRELGSHHTHVALSESEEPAAQVLQLFVFGFSERVPARMRGSLLWAQEEGFVEDRGPPVGLLLTPRGEELVRNWGVPPRALPVARVFSRVATEVHPAAAETSHLPIV